MKSSSQFESKPRTMTISQDNPFKEDIIKLQERIKTAKRGFNGTAFREKFTMTVEREYLPFGFAKLYQNKALLEDLSPDACKVLIHIALNMSWDQEQMKISYREVALERRRLSKALVELLFKRIIVKADKREWYWVNVTLLIVGNLNHSADAG